MVYTFCVVDVKEYIASGILESVVLGLASDQEQREVQCMSHIYPEIDEEMRSVETTFERMVFQSAIEPAAHLRDAILAAIAKEPQIPAPSEQTEAKIVQMPVPAETRANPWKWIAAACIVLLAGASFLYISTSRQASEMSGELTAMKDEQQKNQQIMTAMKVEQDRLTSIHSVLTESSMKKVVMAGTPKDAQASVSVMWSANSNKAVMFAENITAPPTDMQYQLWAIVDAKPVSLGLFNYDEVLDMTEPFEVAMDNVSAFAITLEKKGGSPTPTMENMVVIGTVG